MKILIQTYQQNNHKNRVLKKGKDKYTRLYIKKVKFKKKSLIKRYKNKRESEYKMKFRNVHLAQLHKGQDKCQFK